jgi:hypothetical protein
MRRVSVSGQFGLTVGALLVSSSLASAVSLHDAFNSQQAYAYTAEIAGFGERWPGSLGHRNTEELIHQIVQKDGGTIVVDDFTAKTPRGPVSVHNIIGKLNVSSSSAQPILIFAGHYDTLFKHGFVGANDGLAQEFFWHLPMRLLDRKPERKSGCSGPISKRRSIPSMTTMVSTGANIWRKSWRRAAKAREFTACSFST